jgi:hypothetical protein
MGGAPPPTSSYQQPPQQPPQANVSPYLQNVPGRFFLVLVSK